MCLQIGRTLLGIKVVGFFVIPEARNLFSVRSIDGSYSLTDFRL